MNDYLRQLEKKLAAPAEPTPSPARRNPLDSRLPEVLTATETAAPEARGTSLFATRFLRSVLTYRK